MITQDLIDEIARRRLEKEQKERTEPRSEAEIRESVSEEAAVVDHGVRLLGGTGGCSGDGVSRRRPIYIDRWLAETCLASLQATNWSKPDEELLDRAFEDLNLHSTQVLGEKVIKDIQRDPRPTTQERSRRHRVLLGANSSHANPGSTVGDAVPEP